MTCLIKDIVRFIDIFDVSINMSGLMIKMMMMNDSSFKFKFVL